MAPPPRLTLAAALFAASATLASAAVPRCRLGRSAVNISCIAYGTLHLHEAGTPAAAAAVLQQVVALGITTIDTSDVYNSEPGLLGAALQLVPGLRQKVEIVAKMGITGALNGYGFDSGSVFDTSCPHLNSVLATYLADLATTYVDVLVIHREDYIMDINALAACVQAMIAAGSVRAFG